MLSAEEANGAKVAIAVNEGENLVSKDKPETVIQQQKHHEKQQEKKLKKHNRKASMSTSEKEDVAATSQPQLMFNDLIPRKDWPPFPQFKEVIFMIFLNLIKNKWLLISFTKI